MVELKVGQTVRVYAAVWDFCGAAYQAIYISNVLLDTIPATEPAECQDISGIGIEFRLVTLSGSGECNKCTPGKVYSTWGTAYTTQGLAYIDHTLTEDDLKAYQDATSLGYSVKVLACIVGAKGQQVTSHRCSDILVIHPGAAPTYAMEFKTFENTLGILGLLSNYTSMLTSGINKLIPDEAGWSVARTEIDSSKGIIRLFMSETGSWSISDVAIFLLTAIAAAIAVVCFLLFPTSLGIALGVFALVVAGYSVYRLVDMVSVLKEQVTNYQTKDQNDTRLDQMVANVLAAYEKSPKTKDDCLNKLNGLKIAYTTYLDTMQKDFANLYTPAMKRTFAAAADGAIEQFKNGTITCEQATEKMLTQGGIAKADISTNFSTVYVTNNPYVPPKKEDCWISKPIGEGCLLSAGTGQIIVGSVIAIIGLYATYWAVTRKPAETKVFIEKAKAEYGRAKAAIREIRAPAVPAITGAPAVPRITGAPVAV